VAAWLAVPAAAFSIPEKPAARVNDYARAMDDASRAALESKLAAFERESSTQIAVAIVPSLDGEAIEDVAVRVVERWGLGQKGTNNGVLLLIAMADRRARIEVGYGLEDRLTDALSRRILEDRLFPAFRSGAYGAGVIATCDGIIEATHGAYVAPPRRRSSVPALLRLLPLVVPLIIIVIFMLIRLQGGGGFSGRGGRRFYSSGPIWWGGGFGGFSGGGGLSGGGGASGSW
jgi:uncharacterized protein